MRLKYLISFFGIGLLFSSAIQFSHNNLYVFYNSKGQEIVYSDLIDQALHNDVTLWGELHDDSICHAFESKFCTDLRLAHNAQITIGMEMFEADDQLKIDEYLGSKISQSSFESEARIWTNYTTDYKPIFEEAKKYGIPIIATNVPRRYASMVYRKGLESLKDLSKQAKKYIAPLPLKVDLELSCYKDMLTMWEGHGGNNFPHAQAIKDATMAHFILKNFKKGNKFIHLNGNYHSKDYEGIYWYLKNKKKSLKIMTIATVRQDDISKLEKEHIGEADFILCLKNP